MKTVLLPATRNTAAIACRRSSGPQELLLFFSGWGMDERPFLEFLPKDRDCLLCFDYKCLSFDKTLIEGYRSVKVVGWSMGVWAAAHILQGHELPSGERIAVNGTHFPVNDTRGIPREVFYRTLSNLNEDTLGKFRRRMCGSGKACERFLRRAPLRVMADVREELRCIGEAAESLPAPFFAWSRSIIGRRDRIFGWENQQRAWAEEKSEIIDEAHYPEKEWTRIFMTNDPAPQP